MFDPYGYLSAALGRSQPVMSGSKRPKLAGGEGPKNRDSSHSYGNKYFSGSQAISTHPRRYMPKANEPACEAQISAHTQKLSSIML